MRVGIKTTYVDEYAEITTTLKAVEDKHKRRTIFISGAAHDYSPWTQTEAEKFVYNLSREISKANFRVISGFGLGVGSAVITGVLEQTIMNGGRLDSEQLVLRPFPQTQSGTRPLRELWREYRHTMIDHAGIAIFIFGNKLQGDTVVESNGMREEFEIARGKGVFVIPVGITGSITRNIWEEVLADFDPTKHHNGIQILPLLQVLGDDKTNLDDAMGIVLKILKII